MRDEPALRAGAEELPSLYWHHSILLFPDLEINGGQSAEPLERERAAIHGPVDLAGREVLYIGSWNG